jgi:hypothetical protein
MSMKQFRGVNIKVLTAADLGAQKMPDPIPAPAPTPTPPTLPSPAPVIGTPEALAEVADKVHEPEPEPEPEPVEVPEPSEPDNQPVAETNRKRSRRK